MWSARLTGSVYLIEHKDARYPMIQLPESESAERDAFALVTALETMNAAPTVVCKKACAALRRELYKINEGE